MSNWWPECSAQCDSSFCWALSEVNTGMYSVIYSMIDIRITLWERKPRNVDRHHINNLVSCYFDTVLMENCQTVKIDNYNMSKNIARLAFTFISGFTSRLMPLGYFPKYTEMLLRYIPANTIRWPNVVLMLDHRLRRWPNIKTTSGQRLVFAGMSATCYTNCGKQNVYFIM